MEPKIQTLKEVTQAIHILRIFLFHDFHFHPIFSAT